MFAAGQVVFEEDEKASSGLFSRKSRAASNAASTAAGAPPAKNTSIPAWIAVPTFIFTRTPGKSHPSPYRRLACVWHTASVAKMLLSTYNRPSD